MEAKGAIRLTALRTGLRMTGRGLVGPSAGGRKLPPYALINRARSRGRGVRFTLHAEGRVANGGINARA